MFPQNCNHLIRKLALDSFLAFSALLLLYPAVATGQIPLTPIDNQLQGMVGVSRNGLAVIGYGPSGSVRWTSTGGLQQLALPPGAVSGVAIGISGDGLRSVGQVNFSQTPFPDDPNSPAFAWDSNGAQHNLGALPTGEYARAWGASGDGSTIVGESGVIINGVTRARAFCWTSNTGMTELAIVPGMVQSYAYCVSDNGEIAAGVCYSDTMSRAVRWVNGVPEVLPLLPGHNVSGALGTNSDGSVVIGFSGTDFVHPRVFRWSSSFGIQDLGPIQGIPQLPILYCNDDASIVVGPWGFFWTSDEGIVSPAAHLAARGADVTGWSELSAIGVSANGAIIVGAGLTRTPQFWFGQKDSDLDGLADDWELTGIPYETSTGGVAFYHLLNANPLRKDIYVEVDAMAGRAPSTTALNKVTDAFAKTGLGPVPLVPAPALPGGVAGIALHIETDPAHLGLSLQNSGNYVNGTNGFADFQIDKESYFGTVAERTNTNWSAIKQAKALAYRYCIFTNTFLAEDNSRLHSGVAEGFLCNDFLVTLGAVCDGNDSTCPAGTVVFPNDNNNPGGTEEMQAGTFMHELGHSLGLHHGGSASNDIQYKPNYYSIMNYWWQLPDPRFNPGGANGTWELRYSDEMLPTLPEGGLSESVGLSAHFLGRYVPISVPNGANLCDPSPIPGTSVVWAHMGPGASVDWNNDTGETAGLQCVNINTRFDASNGPERQILEGQKDWDHLEYNFRSGNYFGAGAPPGDVGRELDWDMLQMFASLPSPPCFGDVNSDRLVDIIDLSLLLAHFGVTSGATAMDGDLEGDGDVDLGDLSAVLSLFGRSCPP